MKSAAFAVLIFATSAFAGSHLKVPLRIFNCSVPKSLETHLQDLLNNKAKIIRDCRNQGYDTESCENGYERDLAWTQDKIDLGQKIMSQWKWQTTQYVIYPAALKKEGKIVTTTPWLYDLETHFPVNYWSGSTNEPPAAGFDDYYKFDFKDDHVSDPDNNTHQNANIRIYNSGDDLYPVAFVEQRISPANSSSAWMGFECQFDHTVE